MEPPGSCALETPFKSLINWIITQAIEFPSHQIHPSLPDRAPQLVHEMDPQAGVRLEMRRGLASLKCPHLPSQTPASLPSFWRVESGDGGKMKTVRVDHIIHFSHFSRTSPHSVGLGRELAAPWQPWGAQSGQDKTQSSAGCNIFTCLLFPRDSRPRGMGRPLPSLFRRREAPHTSHWVF